MHSLPLPLPVSPALPTKFPNHPSFFFPENQVLLWFNDACECCSHSCSAHYILDKPAQPQIFLLHGSRILQLSQICWTIRRKIEISDINHWSYNIFSPWPQFLMLPRHRPPHIDPKTFYDYRLVIFPFRIGFRQWWDLNLMYPVILNPYFPVNLFKWRKFQPNAILSFTFRFFCAVKQICWKNRIVVVFYLKISRLQEKLNF